MHEYDRDGVDGAGARVEGGGTLHCVDAQRGRHQGRGGLALASAGAQRGGRAAVAGLLLRCGDAHVGG